MECDFLSMCLSYVIGEEKSVAKTTFLKFFLTAQTAGKTGVDFPRPAYYTNRKRIINKEELMKIEDLCQSPLFYHIEPKDIEGLLNCLGAYTREYKKGEIIYSALDTISAMGLVCPGKSALSRPTCGAARTFSDIYVKAGLWRNLCMRSGGKTYGRCHRRKRQLDPFFKCSEGSHYLFISLCFSQPANCQSSDGHGQENLSLSRKINDISAGRYGDVSCHISLSRPSKMEAILSQYRLTGRSLQIISVLIEAPSQKNLEKWNRRA